MLTLEISCSYGKVVVEASTMRLDTWHLSLPLLKLYEVFMGHGNLSWDPNK